MPAPPLLCHQLFSGVCNSACYLAYLNMYFVTGRVCACCFGRVVWSFNSDSAFWCSNTNGLHRWSIWFSDPSHFRFAPTDPELDLFFENSRATTHNLPYTNTGFWISSGGLFGSSTPAPAGGLFGTPTAAASGGLFGQQTPPASGGIFGQQTPPASGGIFGTQSPAPSGGLFGATTAATTPSLFNTPAPTAFGTSQNTFLTKRRGSFYRTAFNCLSLAQLNCIFFN